MNALDKSVPLENLDYKNSGAVVLAINSSYKAVEFYIYQEDEGNSKKKIFIKFGLIMLND
jgi:hypothetical protein